MGKIEKVKNIKHITYNANLKLDNQIAIVVSHFNYNITSILLEKALYHLENNNVKNTKILWSPGCFEIPIICKKILEVKKEIKGIITLGCVLQGKTKQNEYITTNVINHIVDLSIEYSKPITLGIIAPKTIRQAYIRAYGQYGNTSRGIEAAEGLLQTLETITKI